VRGFTHSLAALMLSGGTLACSPATAAQDAPSRSILFIGNSLTYTNDLPSVVAAVARAGHDSVRTGIAAGPDLAVVDHTNGATDAVAAIDGAGWSFVVLQQGPTPAGVCRDTLVIAAMRLGPHIRRAGGRAGLFLPWPRRGYPGSVGFAGESASLAARSVGGIVIPVGIAWNSALAADATLPLYGPDGYHPAPAGTLLAALTVYDRLFGVDVRAIPAQSLTEASGIRLAPGQIAVLETSAHSASTSWPPDSPGAVEPDTTVHSAGGGPC
jgi:hypothetical protein